MNKLILSRTSGASSSQSWIRIPRKKKDERKRGARVGQKMTDLHELIPWRDYPSRNESRIRRQRSFGFFSETNDLRRCGAGNLRELRVSGDRPPIYIRAGHGLNRTQPDTCSVYVTASFFIIHARLPISRTSRCTTDEAIRARLSYRIQYCRAYFTRAYARYTVKAFFFFKTLHVYCGQICNSRRNDLLHEQNLCGVSGGKITPSRIL